MKKIKNKKILAFLIVIFSFAVSAGVSNAGTDKNGRGWLWGGSNTNLGWISMNDLSAGAGGTVSYGVDIPSADGNLTGYAWSSNVGWIAFDNSSGYLNSCPSGTCSARRVGNSLQGWARITGIKDESDSGNSGGWAGWISLSGTAQDGSSYGVSINTSSSPNTLSGYAWSNELGWIDFSLAYIEGPIDGLCGNNCATEFTLAGLTDWPATCIEFCAEGTPPALDPIFPAAGNTVNWTCAGLNGGNPADCTAIYNPCTTPSCDPTVVCEGQSCTDCDGVDAGTKRCPDLNWQEVKP